MDKSREDLLIQEHFGSWQESAGVVRPPSPLDAVSYLSAWAARLILLAVLLGAPWAFGGAAYEHQRWLYAGVLGALGLWVVAFALDPRQLRTSQVIVPTLLAPLGVALLLGAVQIVPGYHLKVPALEFAADSGSVPAEGEAVLGSLAPQLKEEFQQRSRFSLYPSSTRLELARLTVGVAAFLAGLGLFATARLQRVLWVALGLNGAALAVFGIVQKLSWNEKIYWSVPLTLGGQPFASFVNRNNAAGYLNLCLAAAAGFAVWIFGTTSPGIPSRVDPTSRRPGHASRTRRGWRQGIHVPPWQFLALLPGILILAGVCASLSRGGSVAAAIAALAVLALLAFQRGAKVAAWTACGGLVLCAGLLGWLGLSSGFADRMSTLFDERVAADARWLNWETAWRAVRDFPVLGTGFGTYRYAYRPYETQDVKLWFYNADNHYVEGLTEGGVVGLLLIGVCLALMFRTLWLLISRKTGKTNDSLMYVALFALVSQCVQAGFDYGISVPSNMLTFATICGVIVGEAARRCAPNRPPLTISLPVWQPRLVIGLLSLALLANGGMGVEEVATAAIAREARVSLPNLESLDSLHETQMEAAIVRLGDAVRQRPDDAELQQALGELWIYRYRREAYRTWQARAAENPESVEAPSWNKIDPSVLHRFANVAFREADFESLADLRNLPMVQENLHPARRHLLAARAACPLLPRVDVNLAMLAFLDQENPSGLAHLERAAALSPVDEDLLYLAGLLAEQAARPELSERFWRRSLALGDKHQHEILNSVFEKKTFSEVLDRVLPPSPALLLKLARTRFSGETHDAERPLLIQTARHLLETDSSSPASADQLYWSGVAERLEGHNTQAIALFRQAVDKSPASIDWRLDLAHAYRDSGQIAEAIREARWCSWMSPDDPGVEALLKELLRLPISDAKPRKPTERDAKSGQVKSDPAANSKTTPP